jgi:hypothetical protein
VQGNHAFTLEDDADHKISGYTTFDLLGSRDTEFGTFSGGIQNLLDKQYSTVWGHRLKRQSPRTLFKNRGFFACNNDSHVGKPQFFKDCLRHAVRQVFRFAKAQG